MKQKELLDRALKFCSPANQSGLALRLGVSRQQVSRWKTNEDVMTQDRVERICAIAHEDAGAWWIAISADGASDAMRAKLLNVLKRAGIAALLGLLAMPACASNGGSQVVNYTGELLASGVLAIGIMRSRVRRAYRRAVCNFHVAMGRGFRLCELTPRMEIAA